MPDLITHYYLVVDDGSSDEVQAWLVDRDASRGHKMGAAPADPARQARWFQALAGPLVPGAGRPVGLGVGQAALVPGAGGTAE